MKTEFRTRSPLDSSRVVTAQLRLLASCDRLPLCVKPFIRFARMVRPFLAFFNPLLIRGFARESNQVKAGQTKFFFAIPPPNHELSRFWISCAVPKTPV